MIMDSITRLLESRYKHGYYETYWAFDLHGTIIKPNHERGSVTLNFYPFAKKCLQKLSERDDVRMILATCSYPDEIETYINLFKKEGIVFDYVNENPEINEEHFGYYEDKWYYDIFFEDKAGFHVSEWVDVLDAVKLMKYPSKDKMRNDLLILDGIPIRKKLLRWEDDLERDFNLFKLASHLKKNGGIGKHHNTIELLKLFISNVDKIKKELNIT